mmetsp:Transcript_14347/g.33793  ORF Transcript_14347/g.33793 Transcript_14347/m.33793 type:complete len:238 (+) Transcript_14347:1348-2061(+)
MLREPLGQLPVQIHAVKLILVVEVREAHEADRVDDVRSVHVRRGSPPLVHRPVPRGPLQQEADDVREVVERCEVERGQPVQVRLVDRRPGEEEHLDDALEPPHHREVQRRVPSIGSRVELYLVAPPQQELDDVRQRSPVVIGRSLAVGGPVHRRPPALRHRVRVARVLSQQQLARACVPVPDRVDECSVSSGSPQAEIHGRLVVEEDFDDLDFLLQLIMAQLLRVTLRRPMHWRPPV